MHNTSFRAIKKHVCRGVVRSKGKIRAIHARKADIHQLSKNTICKDI
ncbi:hypothetical protein HMPREF3232_00934 [Fannyhessea vaginae]|nr:hypothetical protein HMPREF3232_00934 [Fannyhessea vaginae]